MKVLKKIVIGLIFLLLAVRSVLAAPDANLWPRWQQNDPASITRIDHTIWTRFLQKYLNSSHPSKINMVAYARVSDQDRRELEGYVDHLQGTGVSKLNRGEQMPFWINLYNAFTVQLILEHYPVESIMDIDLVRGFGKGPWDAKLLRIEGEEVSLNDIEHRILRPIWQDNRIHYAVNCASLSCPNLQDQVFTAANLETLLNEAARDYVNHERGVRIEGNKMYASSIYKWYKVDFGDSKTSLIQHLIEFADPALAGHLRGFSGKIKYDYDWDLNE